jgi:hypothetical protein
MNPNYTEFKFPQIKAHPWHKIFKTRLSNEGIEVLDGYLQYTPTLRTKLIVSIAHPFFDELRAGPRLSLPSVPGVSLEGEEIVFDCRKLFDFSPEEVTAMNKAGSPGLGAKLSPRWASHSPAMVASSTTGLI